MLESNSCRCQSWFMSFWLSVRQNMPNTTKNKNNQFVRVLSFMNLHIEHNNQAYIVLVCRCLDMVAKI